MVFLSVPSSSENLIYFIRVHVHIGGYFETINPGRLAFLNWCKSSLGGFNCAISPEFIRDKSMAYIAHLILFPVSFSESLQSPPTHIAAYNKRAISGLIDISVH